MILRKILEKIKFKPQKNLEMSKILKNPPLPPQKKKKRNDFLEASKKILKNPGNSFKIFLCPKKKSIEI